MDSTPQPVHAPLTGDAGLDFGWSSGSMSAHWLAAGALLAAALGLQLRLPTLWPAWAGLALLAALCFAGGVLLRTSKRADLAVLPMVDLLTSDRDVVLDAGCGAGRTTLALSRVLGQGRVVALDRFDAAYIEGGGRTLLERNLRLAGLAGRVQVEQGDLTRQPFPDATFDAAVSAHVIDHLGDRKEAGLTELFRVLKPGGRLLMVVWVPGWVTFCLANVFCLALTSPEGWRAMARKVGFTLADQGRLNGMWFAVLQRPR